MKPLITIVRHWQLLLWPFLWLPTDAFGAPPHVVIILADDLGYGDVHCLNRAKGKILTPHLDHFASQGMTFTDGHSASAVCTPTRYGLLTGRYAWRTRLQSGVLDGGDDPPLIAANRLTLPGLLKKRGYRTAAIGKWHLGFTSEKPDGFVAPTAQKKKSGLGGLPIGSRIIQGPITRGFDEFAGCSNARTMSGFIRNDQVTESIEPVNMLPRLATEAVDWITRNGSEARKGTPLFLYIPLTSPHSPVVPSKTYTGKSGLNSYADFVMQTDAVVGQILKALDVEQLAENTLVVFSSDNGCSPVAKIDELKQLGHNVSGPFRGHKSDIWEGGHRVPFLVRWPGQVKPGTFSSQLVCLNDLMATCAELLKEQLPANAGEDSHSFLPALLGTSQTSGRTSLVHHSIQGRFAIRRGNWKLALCPGSGGWSAPNDSNALKQGLPKVQLYNLDTDSAEEKNLQADEPAVVQQLTELLLQQVQSGRSTPGEPQPNDARINLNKMAAEGTSE